MLKNRLNAILAALLVLSSTSGWGYDKALAESYAQLFEPVAGAKAGKALHLMKPEALLNGL